MTVSLKNITAAISSDENEVVKSVLSEFGINGAVSDSQKISALVRKLVQLKNTSHIEKTMSDKEWRELVTNLFAKSRFYSDEFICLADYSYMNRYSAIQYVKMIARKQAFDSGVILAGSIKSTNIDEILYSCEEMNDSQLLEYNRSPMPDMFESKFKDNQHKKVWLNTVKLDFFKRFKEHSDKLFYNRLKAWASENRYDLKIFNRSGLAKGIIIMS